VQCHVETLHTTSLHDIAGDEQGAISSEFTLAVDTLLDPLMQNTRLNNLIDVILAQLRQWFRNPWRHLSVVVISLLLGVFLGTAIPTTAGQTAEWDVVGAGVLVLFTEAVSRFVYSRKRRQATDEGVPRGSLLAEILNAFKIGVTYSLFVEAFKLGS
jgi:hypothetical protein